MTDIATSFSMLGGVVKIIKMLFFLKNKETPA